MNLYEVVKTIQEVLEMVDDDWVLLPEFEQLLDKLQMDKEEKFENIWKLIKNLESDVNAIKIEKQRLSSKQSIYENKIERLKWYIKFVMQKSNNKTYKAWIFNFWFRKSSSLNIDNIDLIPDEFKKVTIEAMKNEIKSALKLWTKVEWVSIVENENLTIS